MRTAFFIAALAILLSAASSNASDRPRIEIDTSKEAIARGKAVFMAHCAACHGLAHYRSDDFKTSGIAPLMDTATAKAAFGVVPPDLTLMAAARGKGDKGAQYIYRLLSTYYTDEQGQVKNIAFAGQTQGDGTIAMPEPISKSDPEFEQKARDVSAFLLYASDPAAGERKKTGYYVVTYMIVMTGLLYALNRYTWKGVKKP